MDNEKRRRLQEERMKGYTDSYLRIMVEKPTGETRPSIFKNCPADDEYSLAAYAIEDAFNEGVKDYVRKSELPEDIAAARLLGTMIGGIAAGIVMKYPARFNPASMPIINDSITSTLLDFIVDATDDEEDEEEDE